MRYSKLIKHIFYQMNFKKLTLALCLLALLLANVQSKRKPNPPSAPLNVKSVTFKSGGTICPISVNVLSLSWPAAFCKNRNCLPEYLSSWDQRSFTIHGLWPGTQNYNPRCGEICASQSQFFHESLDVQALKSKPDLLLKMLEYWYPMSTQTQLEENPQIPFLWNHQWGKDLQQDHGKCYAEIQLKLGSELSDLDRANHVEQTSFFNEVIRLYESLNVRKLNESSYSRDRFAQILNLDRSQFYVKCPKNGGEYVEELYICYSIDLTGKLQPQTCDPGSANYFWRNCNQRVQLLNFSTERPQEQVFNFRKASKGSDVMAGIVPANPTPVRDEN